MVRNVPLDGTQKDFGIFQNLDFWITDVQPV
jgi:hypothetical protein